MLYIVLLVNQHVSGHWMWIKGMHGFVMTHGVKSIMGDNSNVHVLL